MNHNDDKQPRTRIAREKLKNKKSFYPKHLDKKTKKIYATYGNGKPNKSPKRAMSSIYRFYPSNKFIGTVICIAIICCFVIFCYLAGKTQPQSNPTTHTTRITSQYAKEAHMNSKSYLNKHFSSHLKNLHVPHMQSAKMTEIYNSQNKSTKQHILAQIHNYNKNIPNLATRRLTITNYLNNLHQQLIKNNQNEIGHSNNGDELPH